MPEIVPTFYKKNDRKLEWQVHGQWKCLVNTVYRISEQSFPLVQLSRQRIKDKPPWITKGLKISIKHKNRLYESQLLRLGRQRLEYNTYKNLLHRCLKEAETKYYQDVFDSNKNSMYNTWKTLNPIINPKAGSKSTSINRLLIDGKVIRDKKNQQCIRCHE